MPTLLFPDRDTLRRVLASASIPSSVSHAPSTAAHDDRGRLWLSTSAWLPKEALVTLSRLGVQILGSTNHPAENPICCWQQLIPLEPISTRIDPYSENVIFDLPAEKLVSFTREIERLGFKSWTYCWLDDIDESGGDRLLLKMTSSSLGAGRLEACPTISVGDDIHAFREQTPNVWIESGWRHEFASQIQTPPRKCLWARPGMDWAWSELPTFPYAIASMNLPLAAVAPPAESPALPLKLGIGLRLKPDDDDDALAELWIIDNDAMKWLERFVHSVDEKLLGSFNVAVTANGNNPIILLTRTSNKLPPAPLSLGTGFKPLLKLRNLFIPRGTRLMPPLRRESLRQLLAADPNRITWLRPLENRSFRAETLPVSAWQRLSQWLDYKIEAAERSHKAWGKSSFGAFERFARERPSLGPAPPRIVDDAPRSAESSERAEAARTAKKSGFFARAFNWIAGAVKQRAAEPETEVTEQPRRVPFDEALQNALRLPGERTLEPQKFEQAFERTKALEARFLGMLTNLSAEERLKIWPEMAAAYMQANNPSEAAACWLSAIWEEPRTSPLWTWGLLKAEAAQAGWEPAANIARWLRPSPSAVEARAVGAYVIWAAGQDVPPAAFRDNLNGINRYLDEYENLLPIRSAWLARSALVRLTRGDVLALAHTRDRILQRLIAGGLSLDVDAPAFIRFAESGDPDRFGRVRTWLSGKRERIKSWIENLAPAPAGGEPLRLRLDQFGLSAEIPCTVAYADLMLSWGLSRLGEKDAAAKIRDEAWMVLDERDPIHAFLKAGFDYRIRQSREGKAVGGPLPPELLGRLTDLSVDDRYRIDRMRQHSRILDPSEHINAYWASTMRHFRHGDQLRKYLIDLPALEPAALNDRVGQLLARAVGDSAAALPDILLGVLDVTARLEPSLAETVLDAVPGALDLAPAASTKHLKLLEKGMLAAALCNRPAHAQALAERFVQYLKNQQNLPHADRLEGLTSQTFRCFRRLGMKDEAYDILKQIDDLLTGGEKLDSLEKKRSKDWPALLRTLLPVAAAYYYSGQQTAGFNIIDKAGADLYAGTMSLADRTALALSYASTLGQVPVGIALGRFGDLFNRLKKVAVNGWNTHYTLQPLQLIDTIVLAVVSEDFILGPTIRAWLDDEEYLIRQRIHQELQGMMAEQGV